jgi:uncharacterized protein involved in exopolysaccharide biosynthesis
MNQAEIKEQILSRLASLKTKIVNSQEAINELAQDVKQASPKLKNCKTW